jgi:membrane-bound lytic murein transglycosylase D
VRNAQTRAAPGVATLADAALQPSEGNPAASPAVTASAVTGPRPAPATHTVARGESAWGIARRYGLRVEDLLARNHLLPRSVLRPGTVLQIALASE